MYKYLFFIIFLLPFIWFSCTDDNMAFDIGKDEVEVKTNMGVIDTFTVRSYTVMLDSVPTSNLSDPTALIGYYRDEAFGTVTASSFFRVVIPSSLIGENYTIPNDAVFDSVSLLLTYDRGFYSGDTTAPFTINVHRLSDKLKPHDDGNFYNHDSIAANSEIFGRVTFRPSPNSRDTVRIPLDPDFGKELFSLMKSDNPLATNFESFLGFFKGFMLRYDESNKAIIGFNFPGQSGTAFPAMRVHFHYFNVNTRKSYFDFLAQSRDPFTQSNFGNEDAKLLLNRMILKDPLIDFPARQRDKLPAINTNDRSFVLAGVGIVTRFEVPYLKNLFYIDDDIRVLDASLMIEPASQTYDETSLPGNISLYATDDLNRWGNIVLSKTNKSVPTLVVDVLYEEETLYTFDVTNFIISSLKQETNVIPAMLLTVAPDDLYKTSRRLVLGSQLNRDNKVKLKVLYMNIE